MKLKINILKLAAAFLALTSFNLQLASVSAQNSVITYQGRVTSNGTNFSGNGQFKFAIVTSTNNNHAATATATTSGGFVTILNPVSGGNGYVSSPAVTISGGGGSGAAATANLTSGAVTSYTINANGSGYSSPPTVTVAAPPQNLSFTTFWSNDGTSSAGSQPTAAVSAAVTNGLFHAALGDATVANMTVIPTSLFVQPNLQLRIWFNDGVNGFGALSPLQNLTPTPYAAYASNAGSASNVLGSVAASQLSGPIPTANLSGTYGNPVTLANGNNSITGTFTGNGAGVTGINLANVGPAGTFSSLPLFFTPPYALNVGTNPLCVVAVDNSQYTKSDFLVSANYGESSLTVLTNAGNGNFIFSATLPVGTTPNSVISADINNDGVPDVISVNSLAGTLTIFTNGNNFNVGTGSFSSNATITVGSYPVAVVAADLNQDGWMDLICANYSSSSLTVLTNNRSGRFGLSATINLGTFPDTLITADVNNDNWSDLVVGSDNKTLMIFTNNTAGRFGLNATISTLSIPNSVTAADLNNDGLVDLICDNTASNSLSVFTNYNNNVYGQFGSNATVSVLTGGGYGGPQYVTTADVNNDGALDVISSDSYSGGFGFQFNSLTILTNNGFGRLTFSRRLSAGGARCVVTADLNGDGVVDLVVPNPNSNFATSKTLTVYLGSQSAFSVAGGVSFTNQANIFSGFFTGNFTGSGANLTSLNAAQLTGGPVPLAVLPSAVVTNNETGVTLGGIFTGNGNGLTNLNAANLTGTIPANVLPGVVETAGSALRVGSTGTTFSLIQAGQAIMPSSSTTETNIVITFPQAFSGTPKILVTVGNDPGFPNVNDIFAASVANVSTTTFRVNVIRLDTTGGWSQQLRINWQAWQ